MTGNITSINLDDTPPQDISHLRLRVNRESRPRIAH
jgi:hypothetical protein